MNAAERAHREKLALMNAGQVGFGPLGTRDELVKKTVAKEEGRNSDAHGEEEGEDSQERGEEESDERGEMERRGNPE